MSGLFGTLNSVSNSLGVQQSALQTTGHNIANANTKGYSRQRVSLVAENPYRLAGIGQLGTGVRISSIDRIVDPYVNKQLQSENSSLEMYKQKADVIGQLESIFNEPSDTGLNNSINEFYSSWTYLSSNPETLTSKTMVAQTGKTFTDTIHHMSNQMDSMREGTVKDVEKNVLDFNTKLEQLNAINKQIFKVSVKGQAPNDLLDQQDKLVGELADIAGIETSYDQYNRVSISIGGNDLLNESSLNTLGTTGDGTGNLVVNGSDGKQTAVEITSGNIKGSQEALTVIDERIEELDNLAFTFATAVNTIHSDNGKGEPFFSIGTDAKGAAKAINVDAAILDDATTINAGKDIENIVSGDGTRAQAIASLKDTLLNFTDGGKTNTSNYDSETMKIKNHQGGTSISGAYNDMVTKTGITKQQADNMEASQDSLVSLLNARKESISGVSINEEVADTMKYQSAFQANSRMITVISDMLDTLINRTGV